MHNNKKNEFIKNNTGCNDDKLSDIKTFKHEKGKVLINSKIANLKQKQVSTNYKFANETSYVNKIKHYPAAIKEWSKNQYSYNKNTNKTYPSLDNKLCILIKSYFNSYSRKLENNLRKMRQRKLKIKQKRSITNKIIPGKTELKHNNDKLIITVYVYNNQKRYYLNKLRKIFTIYKMDKIKFGLNKWTFDEKNNFIISKINKYLNRDIFSKDISNLSYKKINNKLVSLVLDNKRFSEIYTFFSKVFHKGSYLLEFPNKLNKLYTRKKKRNSRKKNRYFIGKAIRKALGYRWQFLKSKKAKVYKRLIIKTKKKLSYLKLKLSNNKPSFDYKPTISFQSKKFAIKPVNNLLKLFSINRLNTYEEIYMKNFSRRIFRREIRSTYLKQLLKFNSIKFDKIYVSILANEVKKLYNKKIEFNFISIKYPFLDSSVFFRIILGKIKKNKHKYLNILNNSLSMFQVQSLKNFNAQDTYNEMYKKDLVIQNLDFNNFNSKPLSDTLKLRNQINGFDLNKDDVLDKYLSDLTYKKKDTLNVNSYNYIIRPSIKDYRYKLINVIKSVKYKYLSGIRMETSGRLSRYNTASRSKSGFSYKGNIKNVNSSYKGLSTVVLRGHSKSNLQYNKLSSKVRIGSFGLKGSIASI